MKYIPADKLIAEIERRIEVNKIGANSAFRNGKIEALRETLECVNSLQQEQPFPRWIHANYSDKPEIRHSPSGKPYLQSGPYMIWLSDLETLPKDGTDLTNPGPEQQEVDLEEEITKWMESGDITDTRFDDYGDSDIESTARHFYELGLNARKEDK